MPYISWNGPAPTTAAQASVAVANGVKTMLQLSTPSTRQMQIIAWGYTIDVAPAGIGTVELLQTDVAATVTAHVGSGLINLDPNGTSSLLTLGTANSGYTASSEGTTTASRVFGTRKIPVTAGSSDLSFDYEFMPDARPIVAVSKFLRVRTTFTATTPTMCCYVVWNEI